MCYQECPSVRPSVRLSVCLSGCQLDAHVAFICLGISEPTGLRTFLHLPHADNLTFVYRCRQQTGNVVISISDDVFQFFNVPDPSSRTMAPGFTQTLTEMSSRNLIWDGGLKRGRRERPMALPPLQYRGLYASIKREECLLLGCDAV
jgi:hypothetical protein